MTDHLSTEIITGIARALNRRRTVVAWKIKTISLEEELDYSCHCCSPSQFRVTVEYELTLKSGKVDTSYMHYDMMDLEDILRLHVEKSGVLDATFYPGTEDRLLPW